MCRCWCTEYPASQDTEEEIVVFGERLPERGVGVVEFGGGVREGQDVGGEGFRDS